MPRREAFTVRLRPGALEAWIAAHEAVWPELLEVQGRCGFRWMDVYALDSQTLVVVSEVTRESAWDDLIDTDVHKRWVASLAHLSESARADDTVERGTLEEALSLTWSD